MPSPKKDWEMQKARDLMIQDLHEEGKSLMDISNILKVHRSSVQRTVKRLQRTGSAVFVAKPPPSRKKTTETEERQMVREVRMGMDVTSTQVQQAHPHVCVRTVRRILRRAGLRWHPKVKKPRITLEQRVRRWRWARKWKKADWKKVIWTDEKRFILRHDGATHCWRLKNERYHLKFLRPRTAFGGGGIMVWGAMAHDGTLMLRRCTDDRMDQNEYQDTLDELLKVCPRLKSRATGRTILMHDGAAPHTAHSVERMLAVNGVKLLPWPANSPDLNPIENLWGYMTRKLSGRQFKNKQECWEAVEAVWKAIPPITCKALVNSVEERLEEVERQQGNPTRW